MTQVIELDGVRHEFPDDASQDDIAKALSGHTGKRFSFGGAAEKAAEPITSVPSTYAEMNRAGRERMVRGVGQIESLQPWEMAKGAGNVALGGLEYATSPINAPLHTIIGRPVEETTGIPHPYTELVASFVAPGAVGKALESAVSTLSASKAARIVSFIADKVRGGGENEVFLTPEGRLTAAAEKAAREAGIEPSELESVLRKKYAEQFAAKGATAPAAREVAGQEFGVKLSPGEAAGDYGTIAREQNMARDAYGPLAGKAAREFYEGRDAAIDQARSGLQQRVAGAMPLVESPIEAGNVVGSGVRTAASQAKTAYQKAYEDAFANEGEFSDLAFHDVGERIRRDALNDANPVVITEGVTPVAAEALKYLDQNIGRLRVNNLAAPRSMEPRTAGYVQHPGEPMRVEGEVAPSDDRIVGVSLKGVDQMRKRLLSFYKSAKNSPEDARAVRRIIAGFDDELETAMAVGLFKGDESALPALKKARALFSDYQKTFRSQKPGDSVGRSMERIVEHDATGGEIANMLLGKNAIGEKGDSIRLVNRLKQVLGPDSEEWSAIRQGMWQRLTSKPEGMDQFGPQALSQRIFNFVNGDGAEMAKAIYSPKEIATMRRFATVLKSVVPPKGTINTSGTAYTIMRELAASGTLGGSALFFTHDPMITAAAASLKIAPKLAKVLYRGAQAERHFARGVRPVRPEGEAFRPDLSTGPRTAAASAASNLASQNVPLPAASVLRQIQGPMPASADQEKR